MKKFELFFRKNLVELYIIVEAGNNIHQHHSNFDQMTVKKKYHQLLKQEEFQGIDPYQLYKYAVFLSSDDQKEIQKTERRDETTEKI